MWAIAISEDLWKFFNRHLDNSIEFWDCPSNKDWYLYTQVDKKTKKFNLIPLYPCKTSWDLNRKEECDKIIKEWHNNFKILNLKGKNFLNLLNNDFSDIEPAYTKGGPWIKNFSFSNSLYAWATWAITNHTLIREYYLRFFLRKEFSYPCRDYPIKIRYHILHDHRNFNKY